MKLAAVDLHPNSLRGEQIQDTLSERLDQPRPFRWRVGSSDDRRNYIKTEINRIGAKVLVVTGLRDGNRTATCLQKSDQLIMNRANRRSTRTHPDWQF